jgi:hypothetical protein
MPLFGMTLASVLQTDYLQPLPLDHIRMISLQIVRGVKGEHLWSPLFVHVLNIKWVNRTTQPRIHPYGYQDGQYFTGM